MNAKRLTCILCPNGCELDVFVSGSPTAESIRVEGNLCPRGNGYALEELTAPKRTLTTSILVRGGAQPQASVKTTDPVLRELLPKIRNVLRGTQVDAPVAIGDVVLSDVAQSGVDVVITRAVPSATAPCPSHPTQV